MPYTVMLWLVHPDADSTDDADRGGSTPRGQVGVSAPPPFTHLSYGVYEGRSDADAALSSIASAIDRNGTLRISHGSRTFLVPAARVHYVVCEEVAPKQAD